MPSELPLVLVFALAFSTVALVVKKQERVARMRHDLCMKMLETGQVTKVEMEEMLRGPSASPARSAPPGTRGPGTGWGMRLLAGFGWLGLMVALGLFIARMTAAPDDQPGFGIAAAIVGCASLGLVGLPLALQEVFGRALSRRA